MAETIEHFDIPDESTCIAVVAALVGDPLCAAIFAEHDIREDYKASERAEFERVESPHLGGMNVFSQNIDLLRALARRTVVGDFASPHDPKLVKFLSDHRLPFTTSGNYALTGRKIQIDDFLTVVNLLLRDKQYHNLVREWVEKHLHFATLPEAEDARNKFRDIENRIRKNLGILDVRPWFYNLVVSAVQQNIEKIDRNFVLTYPEFAPGSLDHNLIDW